MASILIVDDRPTNREYLTTLLGYGGHRLLEAANGAEALDLVRAERPELVLTDILMPVMDGYEFALALRSDPAIATTRIIFLSANYLEADARELARACGVVHYLSKPVDPQSLLTIVDALLSQPSVAASGGQTQDINLVHEHVRLLAKTLYEKVTELEHINGVLDQRVQERTEELERAAAQLRLLSQRLVEMQDDERRRLAAELHDTVCSNLSALNLTLQIICRDLPAETRVRLGPRIDDAIALAADTAQATRNVMVELHPSVLEELGLAPALLSYAEKFQSRTGIPVSFHAEPSNVKLPSRVQDALFRLCLEALHNVSRHAEAKAARVTLETRANRLVLGVEDDGSGFDPAASVRRGGNGGWGLMIMKERAQAIGGELRLRSARGAGTRIEFLIPMEKWS